MWTCEDILKKLSADAFLVTDPVNMRYISGFSGGEGALYISAERRVIITDSRYTEAAAKESRFEVVEESAARRRIKILKDLSEADSAETVGFEDLSVTYSEFMRYKDGLENVKKWIPAGSVLNDLRIIKTADEIALMDKASAIADLAFERTCALIRPGMSELEGAAELEYQMKLCGAEDVSFSTIFAAGRNSSMPHAVPTGYKIQSGDFITIDFGCKYKGYCSDTTRTVAVGKVSDKQKYIYDTVLKAHMEALAVIKPKITGGEVDMAARSVINDAGYGKFLGHATGHAVGLYIHEEPRFAPGVKTVYEPYMTGTVEPGIYLPGEFGVRIEDMVVVTESGCRSFTKLPKNLIEL